VSKRALYSVKHKPRPGLPPWRVKCRTCGWVWRGLTVDAGRVWLTWHTLEEHTKTKGMGQ